jgi:MerR family transcriptional regulator, repressor of the yfmOP operon
MTIVEAPAVIRIGAVAERLGVTTRTIRYYEELGLLGSGSKRSKGSHRLYSEADIARLQEVLRLRNLLGMSLEEIVALAEFEEARADLRAQWEGDPSDAERWCIVNQALQIVERELELVQTHQKALTEFEGELAARRRLIKKRRRELAAGSAEEAATAPPAGA